MRCFDAGAGVRSMQSLALGDVGGSWPNSGNCLMAGGSGDNPNVARLLLLVTIGVGSIALAWMVGYVTAGWIRWSGPVPAFWLVALLLFSGPAAFALLRR
jgi:hypothetical protein